MVAYGILPDTWRPIVHQHSLQIYRLLAISKAVVINVVDGTTRVICHIDGYSLATFRVF
jgi:hypothetical protein